MYIYIYVCVLHIYIYTHTYCNIPLKRGKPCPWFRLTSAATLVMLLESVGLLDGSGYYLALARQGDPLEPPRGTLTAVPTMWGPPVINWLINPSNYSYLRTINHSYWSYLHQLSYRTGAPLCSPMFIPKISKSLLHGPTIPRFQPHQYPP